jgi:hypothetical protein
MSLKLDTVKTLYPVLVSPFVKTTHLMKTAIILGGCL